MHLKFDVLLIFTAFVCVLSEDVPIVNTKLGRIKGSYMTSRLGKRIVAFRGVRYGKPPVGDKRFKQAESVGPWRGIFDASKEGPSCFYLEALNPSEDCLALNIYTTKLPTSTDRVKRPVIVFFHPGAFTNFSAQSFIYGPQYYMDQDIVLVTVNNRLSALGFISTGDHRAPGNLGLKDQVLALRFIRKHIDRFGGDPDSVTITGYSVGGWSVILHMLSPMSRGLFQNVIAMSGTPVTPAQPLPREQKDIAKKQARLLGCSTDNLDRMFECMMKKPAVDFANTLPEFKEFYNDPAVIFSPVVEPRIVGVERFLTAQPIDIIKTGNFYHVPLIIGATKDETVATVFLGIEAAMKGNDSYFQDLNREWERVAPICFGYERDTERSKIISREIRKFYFTDEPISLKNATTLAKVYGDARVGSRIHRTVNLMAMYNRKPVYYYAFMYQGRYSDLMFSDTNKPFGVVHFDDLMYIFHMSYKIPFFNNGDPEVPMIEKMTAMWANFAKTGKPIPNNNKIFINVTWNAFTTQNLQYLEINNELAMKTNYNSNIYAFWDSLFPLTPPKTATHHEKPSTPMHCGCNANSTSRLI